MHWQQQAKFIHPKYYKHLKEVSQPFGDIEMGWFGQISLYIKKTQNFKKYYSKVLPHENYGDWKLRGPCRENLHYLWKRAVRIAGFPCHWGFSPQFI